MSALAWFANELLASVSAVERCCFALMISPLVSACTSSPTNTQLGLAPSSPAFSTTSFARSFNLRSASAVPPTLFRFLPVDGSSEIRTRAPAEIWRRRIETFASSPSFPSPSTTRTVSKHLIANSSCPLHCATSPLSSVILPRNVSHSPAYERQTAMAVLRWVSAEGRAERMMASSEEKRRRCTFILATMARVGRIWEGGREVRAVRELGAGGRRGEMDVRSVERSFASRVRRPSSAKRSERGLLPKGSR